ncbi:hypothetical protein Daus18300_004962 [Diaporthe australafricana]|uniref:F-box domain-containing protein n=1 Tax=Diaporthe australafricana TaxID=127596 RepID=A0ABR3X4L0_9PEZI
MGVPLETALRWEHPHTQLEVYQDAYNYFAKARTQDWDARMKEYWALQDQKPRDDEKYKYYHLKKSSDTPPDLDTQAQAELDNEERDFNSYQLRCVIEMCRKQRRHEFHGFMSLPVEIRDIIYSYVLPKGTVVMVPCERPLAIIEHCRSNHGDLYRRYRGLRIRFEDFHRNNRAPLSLVQGVNKAIHDEAARIYFGKNQFIFPTGFIRYPSYCNLLDSQGISERHTEASFLRDAADRTNNAPLLRDVSYAFDMRDHRGVDYENLCQDISLKEAIASHTMSRADALQALHDQKARDLEMDWSERILNIKRMTLDRLALSFDECHCPIGCCRKVGWVLDLLLHKGPPPGTTEDQVYCPIDWRERPPLVVEVLGVMSRRERLMAQEKLGQLQGSELRFDTYDSATDQISQAADVTGPDAFLLQN